MLNHIDHHVKAALFPERCRLCQVFLTPTDDPVTEETACNAFGRLMKPFLCRLCAEGFRPVRSPRCSICGLMFTSPVGEDHLCEKCITQPPRFTKARAAGRHEKSLLGTIHCLKYKGQMELADPLGRLLLEAFLAHWSEDQIDLVLPVPLHPKRLRARGFNQAYLLIRHWPKWLAETGTPASFAVSYKLLARHQHTPPQTLLDRNGRKKNVRRAFSVKAPDAVHNKRILLVDDVYTTGATANACAKVLLKSGAAQVDLLTLTRTQA